MLDLKFQSEWPLKARTRASQCPRGSPTAAFFHRHCGAALIVNAKAISSFAIADIELLLRPKHPDRAGGPLQGECVRSPLAMKPLRDWDLSGREVVHLGCM